MANNEIFFDVEELTSRELEVLQYLERNLSNKEIAEILVVGISTVKTHNQQIYRKLGVKNRKQAVIRAQTVGLLEATSDNHAHRLQHNLPYDTLPFIGRAPEIRDLITQLVDENYRLITILGPGGMGKTRLSIEVGRQLLGYFVDGVYFVSMTAVTTRDEMITTIAEIVGFHFHNDLHPLQQLLQYLRNKKLLLILDNFEHLVAFADLVTDLLKGATGLKVLATSREKLQLAGEVVYTIGGLNTSFEPDIAITECDSVRLFMDSAQRVNPKFDSERMELIAKICEMLGGMPLAILLATAWLDTLSLDEIEAEISGGLAILNAEIRDVPQRHQSIEMVFDNSWNRLSEQEQQIFMGLSVFRAGFTREAAESVTGAKLRDLQRLVHTSFIQHQPSGRYTIHELMHQYGETKLRMAGTLASTYERYANYFADVITPLNNVTFGMVNREMLEAVKSDFENVRAAWQIRVEQSNFSECRKFLDGIWIFLDSYNRSQEGIDLLEPLVAKFKKSE